VDPDRALVEAAAAGSREAFDELVRRHQAAMITLARVLTSGRGDAEDLAQEVFVRAWKSLKRFRGDSSFRTWLHRVAINVVRTSQTRQGRLMRLFSSLGVPIGTVESRIFRARQRLKPLLEPLWRS
jgi:DNA-directed RNA polymerase specialized sigma24 family protein